MTSTVTKNDPCPCGSGKKHKECCGREAAMAAAQTRNKFIAIGVFMAAGIGAFLYMNQKDQANTLELPPGSVYDEEHGHYHNAKGTELQVPGWFWEMGPKRWVAVAEGVSGLYPQPQGDVPEGKTWSPEHGHWHDVADGSAPEEHEDHAPTPQPSGPVPDGKVWSADHGHWHDE